MCVCCRFRGWDFRTAENGPLIQVHSCGIQNAGFINGYALFPGEFSFNKSLGKFQKQNDEQFDENSIPDVMTNHFNKRLHEKFFEHEERDSYEVNDRISAAARFSLRQLIECVLQFRIVVE